MSDTPTKAAPARRRPPMSLNTRLVFSASEAAIILDTSRDSIRLAMDQAAQSGGRVGLRWFCKPGTTRRSCSRQALEDYIATLERQSMGG